MQIYKTGYNANRYFELANKLHEFGYIYNPNIAARICHQTFRFHEVDDSEWMSSTHHVVWGVVTNQNIDEYSTICWCRSTSAGPDWSGRSDIDWIVVWNYKQVEDTLYNSIVLLPGETERWPMPPALNSDDPRQLGTSLVYEEPYGGADKDESDYVHIQFDGKRIRQGNRSGDLGKFAKALTLAIKPEGFDHGGESYHPVLHLDSLIAKAGNNVSIKDDQLVYRRTDPAIDKWNEVMEKRSRSES